jgi:hypothetical protein
MRAFTDRFGKAPPCKATLLDWEKRAFASGSVKDRPRSGLKKTREETCTAVAQPIERSPITSIRKRAAELQIPRSTMHDQIKKDLKMKGFRPMFVNELPDNDMEQRVVACHALLAQFPNAVSCSRVLFFDECAIYHSSHMRNVVFWSKENPHYVQELERNPPHVMIWVAVSSQYLFGPYFFEGYVNGDSYLDMLQTWLIPQLQEKGIMDCVWLQQDGAPAHFAIQVREFLGVRGLLGHTVH